MANSLEPAPSTAKRMLSLDLLRLLAVVLVLGRHMEQPPQIFPAWLQAILERWHLCGGQGVDLFFVLSGFLVSGLLFAEFKQHGGISIKQFYLRRGWKIYPAFYFLLAFSYICHPLVYGDKIRDRIFYSDLLFIQSYQLAYWNHTWTLAVEEHFYILLPLLLLLLVRRHPGEANPFRALPYIVGVVAVAVLATRIVNYAVRTDYSFHTHAWNTHLRIDALFFGALLGYAYHFHQEWFSSSLRRWRYGLLALGVALFIVVLPLGEYGRPYDHTFGFTQIYLGAAAILVGTLLCQIPSNGATRLLATLGSYSYSIYLWHMALMYWVMPRLRDAGVSWSIRTALYLGGAFVIGIAMAKLLELPVLALRDRLYPSRSGNALAVEPSSPAGASDQRVAA
jgi:peptidoglycan/LPS O-acetylase OafA/YrhL